MLKNGNKVKIQNEIYLYNILHLYAYQSLLINEVTFYMNLISNSNQAFLKKCYFQENIVIVLSLFKL